MPVSSELPAEVPWTNLAANDATTNPPLSEAGIVPSTDGMRSTVMMAGSTTLPAASCSLSSTPLPEKATFNFGLVLCQRRPPFSLFTLPRVAITPQGGLSLPKAIEIKWLAVIRTFLRVAGKNPSKRLYAT